MKENKQKIEFADIITTTAIKEFGIETTLPYQRLVINSILCKAGYYGKEIAEESPSNRIVILPTGAGKSLCFMLPALIIKGITIVAFPLLSLIADQQRRCKTVGMNVAVLKGGMTKDEKQQLFKKLAEWEKGILLTNIESLLVPSHLEKLQKIKITHLVFDEAHTLFEWGESFRPALKKGANIINNLEPKLISAFTATASPKGIQLISDSLFGNKSPTIINANPNRTNISYHIIPTLSKSRTLPALFENTSQHRSGLDPNLKTLKRPAILFFRNRLDTEKTASLLRRELNDIPIFHYHAGLCKSEKKLVEQHFFESSDGILCSTNAYGMGVDKPNIRTVLHIQFPPTLESYLQESGRAGRDKEPAQAWLMVRPRDRYIKNGKKIVERNILPSLLKFAGSREGCRREILMQAMGKDKGEVCTGCDLCDNTLLEALAGEKATIKLITFLLKIYGEKNTIKILQNKNKKNKLIDLKEWKQIEIEELIEEIQLLHKKRFETILKVDKTVINCFNL